jgi:hypothetical protein
MNYELPDNEDMDMEEDEDGDKLYKLFDKFDGEYLEFERIENPLHPRRDICAMLYMHNLFGGSGTMVEHAEHDEIWFDSNGHELEEVLTEEHVLYLTRCGIRYSEGMLCKHV